MTTWEYASILNEGPAPKPTLDGLGADGWELVSELQGTETKQLLYDFKRPRVRLHGAVRPRRRRDQGRTATVG